MNSKQIFLLSITIVFSAFSQAQKTSPFQLLTQQQKYTAGDTIVLQFKTPKQKSLQLYVSNSYGTTVLQPEDNYDTTRFTIPQFLSIKKGICKWTLFDTNTKLSGTLDIQPKATPIDIETYLGPPSIEAGGTDFTMLVAIPTDDLDNPLKDSTSISIQKQFLADNKIDRIQTKNLIGYQRIFSPLQSGRVLLSSTANRLDSKEYDVNVMPAIAEKFTIFYDRIHEYADGNQITTFYTSVLRDKNNNVVSDGTFVDFYIENKEGKILKTSGTTIKGIAYAKILHPEEEDNWTVEAIVTGIAESNSIRLSYKKAVNDFNVTFSPNNRTLKIGPIKSFMNQIIPDGFTVSLKIIANNKVLQVIKKPSRAGFVFYELEKPVYKNGYYTFSIESAGIQKKFESKKIW